jgi:hypothetical protein
MGSMQCNVEFGYQLSICSGTKENQLQLFYERQSGAHLGPVTNFSFSLKFILDSCRFIML